MNISLCLRVYFDDVYGPIGPESSLDTRVVAHLPDAQCQEKTEQREQELWPIRGMAPVCYPAQQRTSEREVSP